MKLYRVSLLVVSALVLAGILATGAAAQTQITGAVSGTVVDPGGALVPNAAVKLVSTATGETLTAATDNSGFYAVSLVKPGNYTMSVEKDGFRKVEKTIAIIVGQNLTANFALEVGRLSEVVQVEAAPPQLQIENANLTTTFESAQVSKLPNPGNDLTAVAQTAPGVLMNTASGGGYGNFTAFGLPATANLFTMNGNDENDPYLNLNNSGASNLLLGTNEVQEVAVVTNGYTGQYGRQAGAQIDYVTKTGSNDYHGNAVYFYNNRVMNANDFFNNSTGTALPTENNNQWQTSFGGPIKKDKIFFFVDYEGLRYVLGTSNQVIIPTPAFGTAVVNNLPSFGMNNSAAFYKNMFNLWDGATGISRAVPVGNTIDGTGNLGCGDLNTSYAGGVLPGFAQFGGSGANPALGGTNNGGGTPCAQWFRSTVGALSREWILAGNVEFHLNDTNRVNVRYRADRGLQPTYTDPVNPAFTVTSNQPQDEGQINWNHIFSPTRTNQLIVSGMYYSAIFGPQATAAQQVFPGTLLDYDTSGWANLGGINYAFPQGRNVSQAQIVDDFTWTRGNHTFRFGGNFRYNKISDFSNSQVTPVLLFFSTTDLVQGINDYISQIHPELTSVSIGIYSLGLYAQDEWRVSHDLKLTLALRADRNSNATCYQKCFSLLNTTFQDLNHDVTVPYSQMINSNISNTFKNLQSVVFQPRVGVAWTPTTKYWAPNSTVIRGGVGLFSDLYPGTLADNSLHNSPSVNSFTLFGLPLATGETGNAYQAQNECNSIFNGVIGSPTGTLQDFLDQSKGIGCAPPNFNSVANKIYDPVYIEWNLGVQHAVTNSTLLDINYVGNHGYNLFVMNPWVNSYGFGNLPATVPDGRLSVVQNLTNGGISNYNGLSVSVAQRATKGLSFRFNYTYSHTLDDVSNGGVLPYSLNNSYLVAFNPYNLTNNYGNSDYDVRHYISANYIWELPFKFSNRALEAAAGGWMISGTIFHRTGLPFSVVDGTTPSNFIGNGSNGALLVDPVTNVNRSCGASSINTPCFSASQFPQIGSEGGFSMATKNSYRGPGYFNTDFSMLKTFTLTERLRFALGANFFNILNHPNFANPISDINNGQLGSIISSVVPPTSPYGAFVGSAVSGRQVQVTARIIF
jgi:Carboxypeptidase regulatory-like domain/TonB-dependent Receptor Plug Domain